ncbi:hypothetical protein EOD42_14310 [Rhodovarius crocodyli]|uniref:Uncharacterized protein n=1 Tax=Rhodovarius crocodyli TaxID=1979269 RepID=A0A437MF38_9PROT|nr:hypothetical protein [Rhodovarius crocodyli]RVT96281.1 hypothetical protein EOD42_14310 [Rhodovarius crocodyli]
MTGLFGVLPLQARPRDHRDKPKATAASPQRTFLAPPEAVAKARALGEVERRLAATDRPFIRGMAMLARAREARFSAAQIQQIDRLAAKYRRHLPACVFRSRNT